MLRSHAVQNECKDGLPEDMTQMVPCLHVYPRTQLRWPTARRISADSEAELAASGYTRLRWNKPTTCMVSDCVLLHLCGMIY